MYLVRKWVQEIKPFKVIAFQQLKNNDQMGNNTNIIVQTMNTFKIKMYQKFNLGLCKLEELNESYQLFSQNVTEIKSRQKNVEEKSNRLEEGKSYI